MALRHAPRAEVERESRTRRSAREMAAIASASCVYPPLLNWAEVGKTLAQARRDDPRFASFLASARVLQAEHGWARLVLTGLETSMTREVFYNSTRWGLYSWFRQRYGGREHRSPVERLGAALGCGALGSLMANPFDLIRVRQQSGAMQGFSYGLRELERFLDEQRAKGRGLGSLWRGWQINAIRSASFTAGSMMTYEETKALLVRLGWEEGPLHHVVAGGAMGFVGTLCYMPADSIRTAVYTQGLHGARPAAPAPLVPLGAKALPLCCGGAAMAPPSLLAPNIMDTARQIYSRGGFLAFFRGTSGALLRTVPACMIFPSVMEQSRRFWGLPYF